MAEAGPSTGNGATSNTRISSRHSRLAFPDLEKDAGPSRINRQPNSTAKIPGPTRTVIGRVAPSADGRRRVKSVDEAQQPFNIGLRQAYGLNDSQRRVVSTGKTGGSMRASKVTSGMNTDGSADYSSTVFSDEYDLCE
jgi:hypothetical protein